MTIGQRYGRVLERVAAAAARAERDAAEVEVVAVSKTFPADVVAAAIDAGVQHIGENRAQELKEKITVLGPVARRATWHFVGPLQTNKVRLVVGDVDLIHSVDRFGLAEAIARRARALRICQRVLIEVNIRGEPTKHGVLPSKAAGLAEEVVTMDGIEVKGLMTIPPLADDAEDARVYFKQLAHLRDEIASRVPGATELSMGMTRDFEIAIEEGATIVRVGEAIFGPRR